MISNVVFKSNVKWNPESDVLWSGQNKITLNYSEHKVLLVLYSHLGKPVSKEVLISTAWPNRIITDSSLFQVIRSLRHKLGEPDKGTYLENVSKVGYILKPEALTVKNEKSPIKLWWVIALCLFLLLAILVNFFRAEISSGKKQEQLYISYDDFVGNQITLYSDSGDSLVALRGYAERLVALLPEKERIFYLYQTQYELYISSCNANRGICRAGKSFSIVLNLDEKEQRLEQIADDIEKRYLSENEPRATLSSSTQWLTNIYRYVGDKTTLQYSTQSISSGKDCNSQIFSGVMYAANINARSHTIGVRGGRVILQYPDFDEFIASGDAKLSILKIDNGFDENLGHYSNVLEKMAGSGGDYYRFHLPYSRNNMSLLLIPGSSMNWIYGLDVLSCMGDK
ncbi:winged helix-turn-helix domain-containing protein [Photobacterium makurazakiensis]|uniref:winged helix-turn-helix domain-containing protein n=1 Tax=Photobacterium makurazakiensis TaxID=2910234 RepID=UPI003D1292AA